MKTLTALTLMMLLIGVTSDLPGSLLTGYFIPRSDDWEFVELGVPEVSLTVSGDTAYVASDPKITVTVFGNDPAVTGCSASPCVIPGCICSPAASASIVFNKFFSQCTNYCANGFDFYRVENIADYNLGQVFAKLKNGTTIPCSMGLKNTTWNCKLNDLRLTYKLNLPSWGQGYLVIDPLNNAYLIDQSLVNGPSSFDKTKAGFQQSNSLSTFSPSELFSHTTFYQNVDLKGQITPWYRTMDSVLNLYKSNPKTVVNSILEASYELRSSLDMFSGKVLWPPADGTPILTCGAVTLLFKRTSSNDIVARDTASTPNIYYSVVVKDINGDCKGLWFYDNKGFYLTKVKVKSMSSIYPSVTFSGEVLVESLVGSALSYSLSARPEVSFITIGENGDLYINFNHPPFPFTKIDASDCYGVVFSYSNYLKLLPQKVVLEVDLNKDVCKVAIDYDVRSYLIVLEKSSTKGLTAQTSAASPITDQDYYHSVTTRKMTLLYWLSRIDFVVATSSVILSVVYKYYGAAGWNTLFISTLSLINSIYLNYSFSNWNYFSILLNFLMSAWILRKVPELRKKLQNQSKATDLKNFKGNLKNPDQMVTSRELSPVKTTVKSPLLQDHL